MRKPPAIIPPAVPKTAPKTAPKLRPQTASAAALLPPAAASVKRASRAVSPKPASVTVTQTTSVKAAAPKTSPAKAAIKATPVKAVVKATPVKAAKSIPVKAASSRSVPVRVVAETPATYFAGSSGQAWRMTSRYAVAYVRDAVLAGELLATEPRHLAKAAMAVYYDRKGKAFAWQFRFETARWAEVVGRLG